MYCIIVDIIKGVPLLSCHINGTLDESGLRLWIVAEIPLSHPINVANPRSIGERKRMYAGVTEESSQPRVMPATMTKRSILCAQALTDFSSRLPSF